MYGVTWPLVLSACRFACSHDRSEQYVRDGGRAAPQLPPAAAVRAPAAATHHLRQRHRDRAARQQAARAQEGTYVSSLVHAQHGRSWRLCMYSWCLLLTKSCLRNASNGACIQLLNGWRGHYDVFVACLDCRIPTLPTKTTLHWNVFNFSRCAVAICGVLQEFLQSADFM